MLAVNFLLFGRYFDRFLSAGFRQHDAGSVDFLPVRGEAQCKEADGETVGFDCKWIHIIMA